MKTIRVYDRRGRLLREFAGALSGSVGMNGALVVRFQRPTLQEQADGTPTYPSVVVIAPGQWHNLEEWDDTPPDTALEARPATELPDVPPPYDPNRTDIGIVRRPHNEPRFPPSNRQHPEPGATAVYDDLAARAARAAQFFAVICTCAQLRCPVEIDPPAMPGWLQQRQPIPRQQCSWEIGHDATETPHAWELHGWPYGINEHHPKCPRFPNPDTTSGDVFSTDLPARTRLAVDMLNEAGHPAAAMNLAAAVDTLSPWAYSRETDGDVTGAPIPEHVEGHHIGERTVPVIPGQRQPGTMPGEG
jgi:hypothetical protein